MRFKSYRLEKVLASDLQLVLDPRLHICSLLKQNALIEQTRLAPISFQMMVVLCEAYPLKCPYEMLVSIQLEISVEEASIRLYNAINEDEGKATFDALMRSVRNSVSRLRDALSPLSIDIESSKDGEYGFRLPKNDLVSRLRTRVDVLEDENRTPVQLRQSFHSRRAIS